VLFGKADYHTFQNTLQKTEPMADSKPLRLSLILDFVVA
jgi:hypothetical protein